MGFLKELLENSIAHFVKRVYVKSNKVFSEHTTCS